MPMSPSSTQPPTSTRTPRPRARPANSTSRRVLPTPASPANSTTCGRPCSARSNVASSRCSSSARPMNASAVNPPAMPASMVAASEDGNGPAVCADPLLVGGATYALTGRSTSRHQRRVACWRRRRGDRALPPSRSWAASCRRSIQRASASTPVSPGCWLCILPSVRCLPSGWTIGLRRRPPPQAATLDRSSDHPIFACGSGTALRCNVLADAHCCGGCPWPRPRQGSP